jgi:hypothetical protein|nr:MAG TPA_asm: hypothetical protein [Caudoviricetes sp.]
MELKPQTIKMMQTLAENGIGIKEAVFMAIGIVILVIILDFAMINDHSSENFVIRWELNKRLKDFCKEKTYSNSNVKSKQEYNYEYKKCLYKLQNANGKNTEKVIFNGI